MADGWRSDWVKTAFWIVASVEALFFVAWFVHFSVTPAQGEFDGLAALSLFMIACVLMTIMLTFALVRNRVVRGIALVMVVLPPLLLGGRFLGIVLATPEGEALRAGH